MISRNYSCLCWKDHIGQSFMHSQNRGCSVHTVRQSEPMDDAHPAVGTQDLNTSPRCEFRNSSIQRVLSKAAARIFGQTHTAWLSSGEIQVQPWALSSLFFFFLTYTFPVHMQQEYGEEINKKWFNTSVGTFDRKEGEGEKGRGRGKGDGEKVGKRTREGEETKKKRKNPTSQPFNYSI